MDDIEALTNIMFAYDNSKKRRLDKRGLKLAHYTTADTAVKIIRGKNVWLRNASNMNDYMEVEHGSLGLRAALEAHGPRFTAALSPLGADFSVRIAQALDNADYNARYRTHITSLSEHRPDDAVGKLSMWRAYGGPIAGVALVFNPHFMDFDTTDLSTWNSPVMYGGSDRFAGEFGRIVDQLEQRPDLLTSLGADRVFATIVNALQFAILSFKHKGFEEEREWRLIHMPYDMGSAIVRPTFETIGGIPEQVYHLPLVENPPNPARPDYNLDKLLHRVIVGPCRAPILIGQTIHAALEEAGVTNPGGRLTYSMIPLRQQG